MSVGWEVFIGDGSVISKLTAPAPSTDYDVEMGVEFVAMSVAAMGARLCSTCVQASDAVSGPTPSGSYYAVELQNTTFLSSYTKYGTATLAVYKRVSGVKAITIAKRLMILLAVPLLILVALGFFVRTQLARIERQSRFLAETQISSLAALFSVKCVSSKSG